MGEVDYISWAKKSLEGFDVISPEIRFLRHSDNLTFQVIDGRNNERYVLRLHKPLTINFKDIRQQPQAILSELTWMDALSKEAGIPVPKVIRNRKGELISSVRMRPSEPAIPCSLLGWIDAEPYRPDIPDICGLAMRLGRLMARMHLQASAWLPPEGFLRPSSGPEHIDKIMGNLYPGVQMGIIKPQDFSILQTTADKIRENVRSIKISPDSFSMIHGDLHTGNWLFKGEEIFPLDFSLCGFGYQLFDIAISAGSLGADDPSLRRNFLEGYAELRTLPDDHERLIEAFFVTSILGYYAFILPDKGHHEWINLNLPRVVAVTCRNFLRGEPIFFI